MTIRYYDYVNDCEVIQDDFNTIRKYPDGRTEQFPTDRLIGLSGLAQQAHQQHRQMQNAQYNAALLGAQMGVLPKSTSTTSIRKLPSSAGMAEYWTAGTVSTAVNPTTRTVSTAVNPTTSKLTKRQKLILTINRRK